MKKDILKKILWSALAVIGVLIYYFVILAISWDVNVDVNYIVYANVVFPIVIAILMFIKIWVKKDIAKKIFICVIIFFILIVCINIYYFTLSYIIEPKIFLSKKYGYSYLNMETLETTSYQREITLIFWVEPEEIPRSAIIKYNDKRIFVYYDIETSSWIDSPIQK